MVTSEADAQEVNTDVGQNNLNLNTEEMEVSTEEYSEASVEEVDDSVDNSDAEMEESQESEEEENNSESIDKGIISVTLPTTFDIPMFHIGDSLEVMSEDIVIRNRSAYPINVRVASTNVSIRQSVQDGVYSTTLGTDPDYIYDLDKIASTSDIRLQLFRYGVTDESYALSEGYNTDISDFVLAEKQAESDSDIDGKFAVPVRSGDYAVLNLRGKVMDGIFLPGMKCELKVQATFDFSFIDEEVTEQSK